MAACAGWVLTLMTIMDLRDVSPLTLRAIQVAQAVGMVGVVPAAVVVLADMRRRAGLAGCGRFAVSFGLIVPDISY